MVGLIKGDTRTLDYSSCKDKVRGQDLPGRITFRQLRFHEDRMTGAQVKIWQS